MFTTNRIIAVKNQSSMPSYRIPRELMSQLGQTETRAHGRGMSVLPPGPDMLAQQPLRARSCCWQLSNFGFIPERSLKSGRLNVPAVPRDTRAITTTWRRR